MKKLHLEALVSVIRTVSYLKSKEKSVKNATIPFTMKHTTQVGNNHFAWKINGLFH